MTRLDVAANEDGELQKIIDAFRERRKNNFRELKDKYQLKAAELDPVTIEYRELDLPEESVISDEEIKEHKWKIQNK